MLCCCYAVPNGLNIVNGMNVLYEIWSSQELTRSDEIKIQKLKVRFYFRVHNIMAECGFQIFSCLKVCFNYNFENSYMDIRAFIIHVQLLGLCKHYHNKLLCIQGFNNMVIKVYFRHKSGVLVCQKACASKINIII